MRTSPPIAPQEGGRDTYLVLDDFGHHGKSWRETNETAADRETVIRDILAGEYNYPVRVVAFNTAEGWSRDVTLEIADEVARRFTEQDEVSDSILEFVEAHRPGAER
jgi:hypothetical protein